MIQDLYHWVLALAQHPNAVMALFWLSFAESSFFPLPPDILLIAMSLAQPDQALYFALITSVGSVLGGIAGYGLGRGAGRPLIKRILSEKRLATVEALYNRYDYWAIGIAGFTPLPYKIFTISAGAFAIKFFSFVLASAISRPARFFLVGGSIYIWGDKIQHLIESYFNLASILFVVLLIGGFFLIHFIGRHVTGESDTISSPPR